MYISWDTYSFFCISKSVKSFTFIFGDPNPNLWNGPTTRNHQNLSDIPKIVVFILTFIWFALVFSHLGPVSVIAYHIALVICPQPGHVNAQVRI